jgi:hypothetical protein
VAVGYRGAFSGSTDNWADGWTAMSQYGYLAPAEAAPENTAPTITAPEPGATFAINVGVNLSVTNTAVDSDLPAQALAFSLLSGSGSVTPEGLFTWRPQVIDSGTTNVVVVQVADDGTPNLTATNTFSVIVNPLTQPIAHSFNYSGGAFSLSVNGQEGPDYAVQVSTNLATGPWTTVFTTNSPAMPFIFTDPTAGSEPMQFYRVIAGPPLP